MHSSFTHPILVATRPKLLIAAACLCFAACTKPLQGWSEVKPWENGEGKVIATMGLALLLASSGKVAFILGPQGSVAAPPGPEVEKEVALWAARPVGRWSLEKEGTTLTLARDAHGTSKIGGYENVDTEVWALLSSPGCTILSANLDTSRITPGPLLQKTYKLCNVHLAVEKLKRAAK